MKLMYEKSTEPLKAYKDETLMLHAQKLLSVVRDYRHNFEITHQTKHFCHKGPFVCPICPVVDAAETLAEDLIEISLYYLKLYKKEFICKESKKGAKYWSLVNARK